jgi:hypothetical protein
MQFADASGYQLRVLRAEIKDDKSFHIAKLLTERNAKRVRGE